MDSWVLTACKHLLVSCMYLVLVSHLASSPHLSYHKVPELSVCFQVGLKHLGPAAGVDAQGRGANKKKGS